MTEPTFHIHEDDWAMIDIVPAENLDHVRATAAEAQEFSRRHAAGVGWTQMYVLPAQPHPISARRITIPELTELFAGLLGLVGRVGTGYGADLCVFGDAFALVGEEYGAIYGQHEAGVVTGLHVAHLAGGAGAGPFVGKVVELGRTYDLILADWWRDEVIDLRSEDAVRGYVLSCGAGERDP